MAVKATPPHGGPVAMAESVRTPSLDTLWGAVTVPAGDRVFDTGLLPAFPVAARGYLAHAIAPGTPLATAVRLRMHGEIKLRQWLPFTADQVIHWSRGMMWRATVWMHGLPIRGFDRLVSGAGAMRWTMLGLIPVMAAAGPDVTRSAAGRMMAESVGLPSALCKTDVSWTERDASHPVARLLVEGEAANLTLAIDGHGG
jgi:hypothetical protein